MRRSAAAVDSDGLKATKRTSFRTQALSLDQQTFPSFAPVGGETVGIGMPVIVRFDVPVTKKATIERHLSVTNSSHQLGAWHWMSDSEVHWRPMHYWKPGTKVTVKADIDSVPKTLQSYEPGVVWVQFRPVDVNATPGFGPLNAGAAPV